MDPHAFSPVFGHLACHPPSLPLEGRESDAQIMSGQLVFSISRRVTSTTLQVVYQKVDSVPTGTCGVCIKDGERSLVANLAAADKFEVEIALMSGMHSYPSPAGTGGRPAWIWSSQGVTRPKA